ncbi:MAG: phosphate acyltransferase PlsX [Ruminococcaceae bacterium]|nr:phosphate acyltransferase PlsX [Oscillospiraceae bacterium]
MRIAVDAFGGDYAPLEVIKGAVAAAKELSDEIILVGKEDEIRSVLQSENVPEGLVSIRHAEEVIGTDEHPVAAIRAKKNSSLMVALKMVKDKEADAVVSAGNTGAYLAGAFRVLGRIKGVKRPALTAVMPTITDKISVILDVGANADCKPFQLVQFAHMGAIYAENVLGIKNPRVALLNIGAEEAKGNALTKETYALLKETKLNFIGNVEPRNVLLGEADVIVSDGFTGNVVIKSIEGTAGALFKMLKEVFYKNLGTKLAAGVLKPGLKTVKNKLDYSEYGGVPLLGVDGVVFKSHGTADAKTIKNAILVANDYYKAGITEKIKELVATEQDDSAEETEMA